MKNFIIWLLAGWILASLFSCQTHRQWTRKGIDKGWIDTTKKGSAMASILPDTNAKKGIVKNIVDTMVVIVEKDCPELKKETKEAMKKAMDKSLNPSVLKDIYKDTTIKDPGGVVIAASFDSHGKLNLKVNYPQQRINPPCEQKFWPDFAIGFMGGSLFMLCVALYLGRKKTP